MAVHFSRTDVVQGRTITKEVPTYTVFYNGTEFWGWVCGGHGRFRAMAKDGLAWGPARRTRAQAVEAAKARVDAAPSPLADQPVPADVKVVRLTADNLATEGAQLVGWLLSGGEDLGPVQHIRVTYDGFGNARVRGARGSDVLGLPSTVTAYKV